MATTTTVQALKNYVDGRWTASASSETIEVRECSFVVTVEEAALAGGFGSAVLEACAEENLSAENLGRLGIPDRFIEHGTRRYDLGRSLVRALVYSRICRRSGIERLAVNATAVSLKKEQAMKSWLFMCLTIGLMQSAVALAEDDKAAKVKDGDVERLIGQLDSDEFAQRESAAKELTKLGRGAIESLTAAAAASESNETRLRSMSVLKALYGSDDAATKGAAKKALEKLSKSDRAGVRRAAEKILAAPQYEIPLGIWRAEGEAVAFGRRRSIVVKGGGGVSITDTGIRVGSGGQLILVRAGGGERRVDIIKGTGFGVLLLEGRKGIEIHVRQPQPKGDPKFSRYLAKDSKELAKKHPKIHKLYKTLDVYKRNQTSLGGVKLDLRSLNQ